MECVICYNSNVNEHTTYVTLPCESTIRSDIKHILCFNCFIMNHHTNMGYCPMCRGNYMEQITQNFPNIFEAVPNYESVLDGLSPIEISREEIINEWLDIENHPTSIIYDNQELVQFVSFTEFIEELTNDDASSADSPITAEQYTEQENSTTITNYCIICNRDIGIDNPRQYCEKTYCPEEMNTSVLNDQNHI